MRLPNFKRLFTNDFEEQFKSLINQLSVSINIGFENLYQALNNNISLKDNVACTVKTLTVNLVSGGTPKTPTSFQLDKAGTVLGLTVLRAVNLTNSSVYPTSGVFISWTQTNNGVLINNITGLQTNQNYQLTIVAYLS